MSLTRRNLLTGFAGAAVTGLAGCAAGAAGAELDSGAPLPSAVAADTELVIAIHPTHVALQASGQLAKLPFRVPQWPNLSAGPDIIQGFRARSIDLASNAGIPPIQAEAINYDARIVAVQTKKVPQYTYATAPGSSIAGLGDLRGRKIGFSQGQAQGLVVLRTLKEQGLAPSDVRLVPLSSTKFLVALQSKQIDIAPLAEPSLTKYVNEYGTDGAKAVPMTAVDYLTILWAPAEVLADDRKIAAIRAFIPFWARSKVWAWENRDAWIDAYYVKDVVLPGAVPGLFVGLRLSVTVSWLLLATVEQVNALSGIGYLMAQAQLYAQTDVILLGLALYAVLGFTSDTVVRLIERRVLAWRRTLTS
jgi:sulfonate transport system substrate-binding protein